MRRIVFIVFILTKTALSFAGFGVLNDPYPYSQATENIYYSSFEEQPKTLDPALSYSVNEQLFIAQIYGPLLEYDYLTRPYQLIPLTATQLPQLNYFDAQWKPLSVEASVKPAYSVYTFHLKKGIFYQPHPALAKDEKGVYLYHHLPANYLEEQGINKLSDFKYTGTRELIVDDYIYQIKRLANPAVSSSIYGLMSDYIVGFKEFGRCLPPLVSGTSHYVDLRYYPLKGVKKLDDYTFEIILKGQYEQFLFWLAMSFFSPIPWEVDLFYAQNSMEDKNLSLSWYPIGTGPFMLTQNNPNSRMVLEKNPNFREDYFPIKGSDKDKQAGYLDHAGERLPLVDKAIFTLEKESIPRWNKFLQGYYDNSVISADSFDQAIYINRLGEVTLSSEMKKRSIYLAQTSVPSIHYMGFNMLDPVVGGTSERARKLRQAISIAVNYDENIAIFYNGRGIPAQGPIPPGILGHQEGKKGVNPYVYQWVNHEIMRRPLSDAKKLMIEAGYPKGVDPVTGRALILNYDVLTTGSPEDHSLFDWMHKQYAGIGIDLNIRATLYNRFQEKMRTGNTQIFSWGWVADYPDPENFLFQLYGENSQVLFGGGYAANYQNPEFGRLFDLMKNRGNDIQRQQLIAAMLDIVRRDAPWVWGRYPEDYILAHHWVSPIKPSTISFNTLKYVAINAVERNRLRRVWNQPVFGPLGWLFLGMSLLILPLVITYFKKEKQPAVRKRLS